MIRNIKLLQTINICIGSFFIQILRITLKNFTLKVKVT